MNKNVISAALLLTLAATMAGCSATPDRGDASNAMSSASVSPTSEPSATATPADEATTSDAPQGPTSFAIGDTATLSQDGEEAATIVVRKTETKNGPEAEFGERPKNGVYKLVTLTVRDTGTQTFDVNPFDFYLRDAEGNKYEMDNGNAIGAFDRTRIDATMLNANEQVKGTLVFDVPKGAKEFVYAPQGQSLGVWKIK